MLPCIGPVRIDLNLPHREANDQSVRRALQRFLQWRRDRAISSPNPVRSLLLLAWPRRRLALPQAGRPSRAEAHGSSQFTVKANTTAPREVPSVSLGYGTIHRCSDSGARRTAGRASSVATHVHRGGGKHESTPTSKPSHGRKRYDSTYRQGTVVDAAVWRAPALQDRSTIVGSALLAGFAWSATAQAQAPCIDTRASYRSKSSACRTSSMR